MANLTTFIFLTILTLISGQCNIHRAQQFFKRSIYEFTVQLASRINQDTENHFITSGVSPWTLISALSLGATEETSTEIVHVLKMHPHPCFNDKYFEIARRLTSVSNNSTILERSSVIFVDNNVKLNDDFKFEVRKAALCNVDVLPFEDTIVAAAFVNDYVSTATHEAIDEIITPAELDGAQIVMIDALFFKCAWKIQFDYADTEVSAFHNDRGNQIGDVNLMFGTGVFNITSVKQIQAKVLELPYGDENRFSMLIFLPNIDITVSTVLEKMKDISLKTIFVLFEKYGPQNVAVQIPRFKITSDVNLKELLIDMGLTKMFDRNEARFDDMTIDNIFVSNLIQKADIEVTEDGTVASAVSEAIFEARMMPEQFTANKPFIFMIIDRYTEIPLFTGAYTKPNVY